jgi:hypothetical protein
MQYILSWLPVLACPVGMGLMMWFMMRGNKQQTPGEVDQARMPTDSQPLAVAESPTMPPRRASTFNLLGMCLNWKVLGGLAVVALLVLLLAPQFIWAALPILLIAACPLSMLFMMRGMSGRGNATASQPAHMQGDQFSAGLTRDERLAELQSHMSSMQAEQEDIARQIAEMESPEVRVVSEAEMVARETLERNRKRATSRRR